MTIPGNHPDPAGHVLNEVTSTTYSEFQAASLPLGPWPTGSATEGRRSLETAVRTMQMEANGAAEAVKQHQGNDMLPTAARDRLISERLSSAEQKIAQARTQASTALAVIDAGLVTSALPKVHLSEQMTARDDAKFVLTNTAPDQRGAAVQRLAARDDSVAGLLAGQWGLDVLITMWGDDMGVDMHRLARETAVQRAATSADPERRTAARQRTLMGQLHNWAETAGHGARLVLDSARPGRGSGLRVVA